MTEIVAVAMEDNSYTRLQIVTKGDVYNSTRNTLNKYSFNGGEYIHN